MKGRWTRPTRRRAAVLLAVCAALELATADAASAEERAVGRRRVEVDRDTRRARGEMVPGRTRYTGEIRVQGQVQRLALTTSVRDGGREWIVKEEWVVGSNPPITEWSALDRDTLALLRHRSDAGTKETGVIVREFEVKDGWAVGWRGTPDSPDPLEQIFVEVWPHSLFADGAGAPQVIATLPLDEHYTKTIWGLESWEKVGERRLEVAAVEPIPTPAGPRSAWKVVVRPRAPGGHVLTLWIDTRSRHVLRYDGTTDGPGPEWTLTWSP
jgi:hypothetical protein